MSQYAWCTDIHLDHLMDDKQKLIAFGESLVKTNPTGVFVSGDISTADKLVYHLSALERIAQRPIFFTLGNHDYYGSSIETVRATMKEITNASQFLRYLPTMPYISLTSTTALVGHDGWADAGHGNPNSGVQLTDWTAIREFLPVNGSKQTIVTEMRKWAHEGALHVHNGIKAAAKYHKRVIVITHYPPYPQCHIYDGKQGDKFMTPFFVSKLMGDVLSDAAKSFPNIHFNVLCGHTHGAWDGSIASNLEVHVGGAAYGKPQLAGLIEVA